MKLIKPVFLLFFTLTFTSSLFGEIRGIGAKVGVTFARLSGGNLTDLSTRRSFALGGFIDWGISDKFGFQLELLYNRKGATTEEIQTDEVGNVLGVFNFTLKLDYLELPVLSKFEFYSTEKSRFHLLAGPSFSKKFSGKVDSGKAGDPEFEFAEDHNVDVGLVFGGDLEFKLAAGHLVFAPRFHLGLTKISDTFKNRVISLMVGYSR